MSLYLCFLLFPIDVMYMPIKIFEFEIEFETIHAKSLYKLF